MPSPPRFVDRLATIEETADSKTSGNAAQPQAPGYRLVRVAVEGPGESRFLAAVTSFILFIASAFVFPLLRFVQMFEIANYVVALLQTSFESGVGISAKLFAVGQFLDLIPNFTDTFIAFIGSFYTQKIEMQPPGLYIAEGDGLPGVDLILTACGEPVDIVLDTVKACLDLDYPRGKLRIIVSDDGHDPALKSAISPLSMVFEDLMYFTRTVEPGKHHGFKAGNINTVLRMLEEECLKPNHWVCNLDCDMIPDREMLRILMAPALRDSAVGLVTLPQDFYNIPLNDPLHENLVLQHQKEQLARNRYDAAWCPGSGFIFKRAAWKKVGGFFERSMCDDVYFGWSLNGSGYKTVYVNACLQSGLQPESFLDHMKQRRRWFVGGMRNAKHLRLGIGHPILNGMTTMQKLMALNQIPKPYLSTLIKGIVALINVLCLVLGIVYAAPVVNTANNVHVRILYAYFFHKMATFVFEGFTILDYGHNLRRRAVVGVWQGIHLAKAALDEELPSWLGGYTLGFQTTGARTGTLNLRERDAAVRPSAGIRLSIIQQTEKVMWHLVYVLVVAGLTAWNVHHIAWAARSSNQMWYWLIIGPLFPGLKLENIFCHLSPIWYALNPPTMPDRTALMYFDERTGGFRPKPKYRGVRFTRVMWFWELLNIGAILWSFWAFFKMNGGVDGAFDLAVWNYFPSHESLGQVLLDAVPIFFIVLFISLLWRVFLQLGVKLWDTCRDRTPAVVADVAAAPVEVAAEDDPGYSTA